jgi:chromate transporter
MLEYFQLFSLFFKIGMFSFGGGYAMLPLMFKELNALNIMPIKEFSDLVALSQMTPGPIAVNAATYIGFKASGVMGSIFATIGVSLPSFILILIISAFFYRFKTNNTLQAVLHGIRPATVGMIASAVIFMSKTSILAENFTFRGLFSHPLKAVSLPGVIIFVLTVIGSKKFKIGPITLTIIAGVLGAFIM